jgi:hypothetical protein
VIEEPREPQIPSLRHASGLLCRVSLFRIEVNIDVLGLQHFKVKVAVLDFVSTEVLGLSRGGPRPEHKKRREKDRPHLSCRRVISNLLFMAILPLPAAAAPAAAEHSGGTLHCRERANG